MNDPERPADMPRAGNRRPAHEGPSVGRDAAPHAEAAATADGRRMSGSRLRGRSEAPGGEAGRKDRQNRRWKRSSP